jgi:hypothetical protein
MKIVEHAIKVKVEEANVDLSVFTIYKNFTEKMDKQVVDSPEYCDCSKPAGCDVLLLNDV